MDWIGLDWMDGMGYITTAVTPRASLQSDANKVKTKSDVNIQVMPKAYGRVKFSCGALQFNSAKAGAS